MVRSVAEQLPVVLVLAALSPSCGGGGSGGHDVQGIDLAGADIRYETTPGDADGDTVEGLDTGEVQDGLEEVEPCVPVTSTNGYRDLCDGTILAPDGRLWARETFNEPWQDGKNRCENLDLAGWTDWRMPDMNELRGLIRGCPETEPGGACGVRSEPKCYQQSQCWSMKDCWACSNAGGPGPDGAYIDELFVPAMQTYWSSLMADMQAGEKRAWCVSFYDAGIRPDLTTGYQQVRCVRGP